MDSTFQELRILGVLVGGAQLMSTSLFHCYEIREFLKMLDISFHLEAGLGSQRMCFHALHVI